MMEHMTYVSKSPEKSSPSFPEDVEDDEDDPTDIRSLKFTPCKSAPGVHLDDDDPDGHTHDVTMLAEDDDDDLGHNRGFSLTVDSPRHPTDSSEKKVHWSNQNVQTLLDCVERHLDEFNIQKKHKQVWQTIGAEMEALGFTMEHCYNKWKNLRRDVRLLVNNPQKAVRNADILRRVARLILVIYPNIDATTMQVTGDRNGGKSAPTTPVGLSGLNCKVNIPSALHAPDSPCFLSTGAGQPHSVTPGYHSATPNGLKHKNDRLFLDSSVPGTALFTNLGPERDEANDYGHSEEKPQAATNANTTFPFIFNPAAAALLVQSQLFNDLLRQQQQQHQQQSEEPVHEDNGHMHDSLAQAVNTPKFIMDSHSTGGNAIGISNVNGLHTNNAAQVNSLASTLLNGLATGDHVNQHLLLSALPGSLRSDNNHSPLDRLPPGSELAGVVERLRDEETVHMRLTDMVTHIADELRAAGMRRRAALDQLLGLMQGSRLPSGLIQKSKQADTGQMI